MQCHQPTHNVQTNQLSPGGTAGFVVSRLIKVKQNILRSCKEMCSINAKKQVREIQPNALLDENLNRSKLNNIFKKV